MPSCSSTALPRGEGPPLRARRAALGYVDGASPRTVAIVLAFAAGAVLTMLANTMIPEALHHGGKVVGFVTTVGFALAFGISVLQ